MKDKVVAFIKNLFGVVKSHKVVTSVAVFCIVALILILTAIFALQEFVVSVCVLIIIEVAMAEMLHHAEIWKHGILLGLQIAAGVILERVPLIVICIIAYIAATLALKFMEKKKDA